MRANVEGLHWYSKINKLQLASVSSLYFHVFMFSSLNAGNGLGIRVVGGKEIPWANGEIGAYIAKILPGGSAEQTGKLVEGTVISLSYLESHSRCLPVALFPNRNIRRPRK